jgi:hypothetical protein
MKQAHALVALKKNKTSYVTKMCFKHMRTWGWPSALHKPHSFLHKSKIELNCMPRSAIITLTHTYTETHAYTGPRHMSCERVKH